jgi:peptide chain release factor 2
MLDGVVVTINHLTQSLADNTELFEMSKADGDDDGLVTIEADTQSLVKTIEDLEFRRMFSQEADPCNAFLTSKPAPVAPKLAIGPACCCANI